VNPIRVKITILNLQNRIPVAPEKIKTTVNKVLSSEGTRRKGEITLLFCDDRKIRELNREFLGKRGATDVIAFNLSEKGEDKLAADIAVSAQAAERNARIFRTSPLYELHLYVAHGVLHILGYDDRKAKDTAVMREKEETIMASLRLSQDANHVHS